MNLTTPSVIHTLLHKHGFHFSKSMGQNFLINPNVCPKMVAMSGADSCSGVLEIGPGIGVLTKELAKAAKRVVSIELDKRLLPILSETLSDNANVEIIQGDAMKLDLSALIAQHFDGDICVCANLPYYITTPLIMRFLEEPLPIRSITVMVQKEAAQRICAQPGQRECGAVSIGVHYRAKPEILFQVSRGSFMPPPHVDSAVIRLTRLTEPPVHVLSEMQFFQLVKASFSQRRKTAVNAISATLPIDKSTLEETFARLNLSPSIRAEQLALAHFADIANDLYQKKVEL